MSYTPVNNGDTFLEVRTALNAIGVESNSTAEASVLKQTVFTGICQHQFLTEADIIINNTNTTLTIATVRGGETINSTNPICFYTDGDGEATKHTLITPAVFTFTNTLGIWYFYFNSAGEAVATQTPWSDFSNIAAVYRIYWNPSLTLEERCVIESVEFHKNDISWADHAWKHNEGTKWISGFNIGYSSLVSGSPAADGSNSVITLSSGTNVDDNLFYTVTHAASGSTLFTQNLGSGLLPATSAKLATITNDVDGKLNIIPATDFPFLWSGDVPQYLTSTGVRTNVGSGNFFVYYVYALQDPQRGMAVKLKSAQVGFTSQVLADAHSWEELQVLFPTLRDNEIRLLYKLTFEYRTTYSATAKKSVLRKVDDLRKQRITSTAVAGGTLPATSVTLSPIVGMTSTNIQSAIQELYNLITAL